MGRPMSRAVTGDPLRVVQARVCDPTVAVALLVPLGETRLRGRLRDWVAEAEGTEFTASHLPLCRQLLSGEARIGGAVLLSDVIPRESVSTYWDSSGEDGRDSVTPSFSTRGIPSSFLLRNLFLFQEEGVLIPFLKIRTLRPRDVFAGAVSKAADR